MNSSKEILQKNKLDNTQNITYFSDDRPDGKLKDLPYDEPDFKNKWRQNFQS